jgi:hypothetical protein
VLADGSPGIYWRGTDGRLHQTHFANFGGERWDRETRRIVPGDPVMLLAAEPADIAQQLGVTFQETFDGLVDLRLAVLELETGLRLAFARHHGQPVAGTQLWVRDEDRNQGDAADSVIDALGLQADVLWRRDSRAAWLVVHFASCAAYPAPAAPGTFWAAR